MAGSDVISPLSLSENFPLFLPSVKEGVKAGIAAALIFFYFPALSFSEEAPFSLSGHYRNLLIISETQTDSDDYFADSNRLRLDLKGKPSEKFSYNIQYDNNIVFGDYLETSEFQALEAASGGLPRKTYWDMKDEIKREDKLRWDHSIYRAYATIRQGNVDLKFGRQRIPWGKGWFWSPLDMFNPVSPTAIERGEREGVDGALMTYNRGTVGSASLLYLPQQDTTDSVAGRVVELVGSYDIALSLGRHRDRDFAGIDFAGYIGDAGFYGEIVSIENERGEAEMSYLFSGNYNFESSLYVMVEYFHNGGGNAPDTGISYDGEDYLGLQAGHDLTPLTRWENYLIVNMSDGSRFFSPLVASSLQDNVDLTVGVQFFGGDSGDEYGKIEDMYYAEFNWYF